MFSLDIWLESVCFLFPSDTHLFLRSPQATCLLWDLSTSTVSTEWLGTNEADSTGPGFCYRPNL